MAFKVSKAFKTEYSVFSEGDVISEADAFGSQVPWNELMSRGFVVDDAAPTKTPPPPAPAPTAAVDATK